MIYQTVVVISILSAVASAQLYTPNVEFQKFMWAQFKQEYSKSYLTEEIETKAFAAFLDNLVVADERNSLEKQLNGTAVHGITHFFDLTQDEFASRYLTADPSLRSGSIPVTEIMEPPSAALGLVDWTGKYTTPVKDQGQCGSCWAFSATEQIESDAMRKLGVKYTLSPQQITSCDTTSQGCNGGWTENAYNYVKKAGGIEQNSDYPYSSYSGTTGRCNVNAAKEVISVSGYSTVKGESSMASYVQKTGPLSVCLDASSWSSYKGGIMSSCTKRVNHCVQAVGVDASSGGYWKVRNSWGTRWGESGFIRLSYGQNTCAITNDPTYVTVAKK